MKRTVPETGGPREPSQFEMRPEDRAEPALVSVGRLLVSCFKHPAVLLTAEGALVDANTAALAGLGVDREQAGGKQFRELVEGANGGNDGRRLQDLEQNQGSCSLGQLRGGSPLAEDRDDSRPSVSGSINPGSAVASALGRAATGECARCTIAWPGREGGGAVRPVELAIRPITGDDGKVALLLVEECEAPGGTSGEKQAERRLKAAEDDRARFEDLAAQAPAGIAYVAGPTHRWAYVNQAYVRLSGRDSAADFVDKTVREIMPEMESQGFPELLDEVYRTGEPFIGREVKAQVHRAGSGQAGEGYFDFEYQPMRDSEGKVEGVFVYALEVTDKVRARKLVEENSERLRLAQAAAQIGSWEWDPIRGENELSPELHSMFGTSADDPQRVEKWFSLIHPADRQRVELLMREGHRLGRMEFEYSYLHPESGQRQLFCKGLRRPGETRMFGIVEDVTARKAAEQDAQRLAAIVASCDDAIVGKDLKGIVTSWNAGAERIFGYTAAEMVGKPITTIIPPELYPEEKRILATIARGDRIQHYETVRVKKGGALVEISLTISPVRDKSGAIIGAAKIARDITQHKKVEQALRTTERLASVGRLAATVAHEINNPLEAVTNLIYLARHTESRDQACTYLGMVEEELERISHLTKQTLGFYRETKGATPVHMGELVKSLLTIFAPRMRNRDIHLTTEIEDVEIRAIPGEIRQVVANLVSNSIDALEAGGRIQVRVSPAAQWGEIPRPGVRLTVADSGKGIPSAIRTQLFEPFFTTKKDVGTGLGLWICKSIVENHRGSIHVRSSTAPGTSGTVFSVFLPLAGDEAAGNTAMLQRAG